MNIYDALTLFLGVLTNVLSTIILNINLKKYERPITVRISDLAIKQYITSIFIGFKRNLKFLIIPAAFNIFLNLYQILIQQKHKHNLSYTDALLRYLSFSKQQFVTTMIVIFIGFNNEEDLVMFKCCVFIINIAFGRDNMRLSDAQQYLIQDYQWLWVSIVNYSIWFHYSWLNSWWLIFQYSIVCIISLLQRAQHMYNFWQMQQIKRLFWNK